MTSHKCLSHYIRHQAYLITTLAPLLSGPKGEEQIHQVRVATRRMRAAFWILKRDPKIYVIKDLNRYLKKLGKLLGRIRDLDVAIVDAKIYKVDSEELKSSQQVLNKKIQKLTLKKPMKQVLKQIVAAENLASQANPRLIRKARNELCGLIERQIEKRPSGAKKLHQLRINLKKTRYILESIGEPVTPLKPLQDILGEAHDLQILQHLIGKNKKLKSKESLLNKKAVKLVGPALQFAVQQLKSRNLRVPAKSQHRVGDNATSGES